MNALIISYPMIVEYTASNLAQLLRKPIVSKYHPLLKNGFDFPVKAKRHRIEVFLQEKNNTKSVLRDANLFEILGFSIIHPNFIREVGSIEGFDKNLEEMGNQIGIELTVPIVVFSGGKIQVDIVRRDRSNECTHKLSILNEIVL